MSVEVPNLVRFTGTTTEDGRIVVVAGKTDDEQPIFFGIPRDSVQSIIARLANLTREAAQKAGWTAQPIAGQDDKGIWMRPTQYGLVEIDTSDNVHLAIDVGPVRFRFALTKRHARELGQTLQAAAAPQDQHH